VAAVVLIPGRKVVAPPSVHEVPKPTPSYLLSPTVDASSTVAVTMPDASERPNLHVPDSPSPSRKAKERPNPATTTKSNAESDFDTAESALARKDPRAAIHYAKKGDMVEKSPRTAAIITQAHCQLGDRVIAQRMLSTVDDEHIVTVIRKCRDAGVELRGRSTAPDK
jgi:hypothetical protein